MLIVLTLIYLCIVRLQFHYRRYCQRRVLEIWTPLIEEGLQDKEVLIPKLPFRDSPYFLELWIEKRLYSSRDEAEKLDLLAGKAGLDAAIERILMPPFFGLLPRKIWLIDLALLATQYIHTEAILKQVNLLAESSNQYIAVKACSCLAILKVPGYDRAIIRALFRFPGKTSYFSTHISRAGGSEVFKVLAPFLDKLPEYTLLNFLSLADKSKDKTLLPLLEKRLGTSRNNNEIAALLRVIGSLGDVEQRDLVVPLLKSDNFFVKAQALKALGELGKIEDLGIIYPYLSDTQWWVRYRAARAILVLCEKDRDIVEKMRSKLTNKKALAMWNHVVAEQDWCLT